MDDSGIRHFLTLKPEMHEGDQQRSMGHGRDHLPIEVIGLHQSHFQNISGSFQLGAEDSEHGMRNNLMSVISFHSTCN